MMGGNYQYSRAYGLYFQSGSGNVAAGTTRYFTYAVHVGGVTTVRVVMPHDALLSNLIASSLVAAGAGASYTYTLWVNGAPTAITCQTAGGAATWSEDIVNAVAVARGDHVVMQVIASGVAVATTHNASFMVKRI